MIPETLLAKYADIFAEQSAYYQARAPEYDQWWKREGRYDLGEEGNAAWAGDAQAVRAFFDTLPISGHILELAGGTGIWTEYLASRTDRLTVVDGSESMLQQNRTRLEAMGLSRKVKYLQSDLLRWAPDGKYDAIFMAFWISHIPEPLLAPFFSSMANGLRKGGILVTLEGHAARLRSPKQGTQRLDSDIEIRTLNNGRQYRIIKRDYDADTLVASLSAAGMKAQVKDIGAHFRVAVGEL